MLASPYSLQFVSDFSIHTLIIVLHQTIVNDFLSNIFTETNEVMDI